jgi:pentatricopeptide repeat protein
MAEQILRDMDSKELGETKSNITCYNAVMNAWSRSNQPNAVRQAQALFDELTQKYEAGDSGIKPNLHTFATLITAWGRSKDADRAAKAQAVFDNLLSFYTSGHQDLKPNVVVYTAVIHAWAHAGVPERAEQILREMESEASLGIKPDVATYTAVIEGWFRSKHPKATDQMQRLYDEMRNKYLAGDDTVKPNGRIFKTILSTWRRTGRKDGMLKAEDVFRDLHARFVSGEAELEPLVDEFGSLFDRHPSVIV